MRIKTENGEELIGRMKGYDNYSLIILTDSTELSIAYADVVRLQRSLGGRARYKNSAMIGLGAGLVVGLVAAGDITEAADQFVTVAGVGLLGGMGGLINAGIRREKWERLDIPDQSDASVMPDIGVQPPGLLALENRMRITTENGEKIIGQLKGYHARSLTILTDSTELSIAFADMVRLQRSLGLRSRFLSGALIGLGAGALVGMLAASNIEQTTEAGVAEAGAAGVLLVLGSGGGLLLGIIVGATSKREKWERLNIPGQGAASVMPIMGVHPNGRLALGARISF